MNAAAAPRHQPAEGVLLSIHDVMPVSLPAVERILTFIRQVPAPAVVLLVVPGLNWTGGALKRLQDLSDAGYILAGHGWRHRCSFPKTCTHRLHAAFFSRRAAEHLSLTEDQIAALIDRCHRWFGDHGLPPPDLYVPPAWALGALEPMRLARRPFRFYETLGGIRDVRSGCFWRLPLAGFEADTGLRARALRPLNALQRGLATYLRRPLRLAIHPFDLELKLAADLRRMLQQAPRFRCYRTL